MNENYLSDNEQDLLLEFLTAHLDTQLLDCCPLHLNNCPLGLLSPRFKHLILNDLADYTKHKKEYINIQTDNWKTMAELLKNTTWHWHQNHIYTGWRNELFDVRDEDHTSLFPLERSAFRPLGLKSHAVHLNAWYFDKDALVTHWIARRSPHKMINPNQLDNITCGGNSAGESLLTSLIRESFEEAGITPAHLANVTQPVTYFNYSKVHSGVRREFLHIYHLEVDENFKPCNRDGEVSHFQTMCHQEIVSSILNGEFMVDSVISLLDLFLRLNCIHPRHPLTLWLRSLQVPINQPW